MMTKIKSGAAARLASRPLWIRPSSTCLKDSRQRAEMLAATGIAFPVNNHFQRAFSVKAAQTAGGQLSPPKRVGAKTEKFVPHGPKWGLTKRANAILYSPLGERFGAAPWPPVQRFPYSS